MIKKGTKPKGKKKVNARQTVVGGIKFASELEAEMYKLLVSNGIEFTYEGNQYETFKELKLEFECWERATKKSKAMIDRRKVTNVKYTPDFIGKNEEFFIEVKGRANESFSIRWKLFKKSLIDSGKTPLLFKPMNLADCKQVVEILKSKGYGGKK